MDLGKETERRREKGNCNWDNIREKNKEKIKNEPERMEDIHGSRPSKHSRVATRGLTVTLDFGSRHRACTGLKQIWS